MILKFNKQITKESYYRVYLTILNGILKLTSKEIDILSEFLLLREELDWRPEDTFSTYSRNAVCTKLGITIHNLNNYIKALKKKNLIVEVIHPKETFLIISNRLINSIYDNTQIVFNIDIIE